MCRFHNALGGLASLILLAVPLSAQDPWSRVPAFPTACYDNATPGYTELLSNFRNEIVVAADKQNEVNDGIRQKLTDMDPGAQQQKMMAFLMKNPAEAQKFMQDAATAGEQQTKAAERNTARKEELARQLAEAEEQYAEDSKPMATAHEAFRKEVSKPGFGDATASGRLAAQVDAEYDKLCAKHLKAPDGPLLKYLADYKRFLQVELIPSEEGLEKNQLFQFELYGISRDGYKSTTTQKAVVDYLDQLSRVFGRRKAAPVSGK